MSTRELDRRDGLADTTSLQEILARHRRVVIAGGPKTGKTTICRGVTDRPIFHTDDLDGVPWGDIPGRVIDQVKGEESYVLEGVQAGRALRKGLQPDVVVYLTEQRGARSKGQQAMAKGCATIFRDWLSSQPPIPVEYNVE